MLILSFRLFWQDFSNYLSCFVFGSQLWSTRRAHHSRSKCKRTTDVVVGQVFLKRQKRHKNSLSLNKLCLDRLLLELTGMGCHIDQIVGMRIFYKVVVNLGIVVKMPLHAGWIVHLNRIDNLLDSFFNALIFSFDYFHKLESLSQLKLGAIKNIDLVIDIWCVLHRTQGALGTFEPLFIFIL